jgi:hypothetical protein
MSMTGTIHCLKDKNGNHWNEIIGLMNIFRRSMNEIPLKPHNVIILLIKT